MDPRKLDSVVDPQAVDLKGLIVPMGEVKGNTPPDPKDPDSAVVVYIKEKKRGGKGKIACKRSRSLTLYSVTLEDIYDRVVKALKTKGA